jgi:hypothetical protein
MSKGQTQAERLTQQINAAAQPQKELTQDGLKKNLQNKDFSGKKVDVPVDWISTANNQRSKIDNLDSLKLQIREFGLLQPIGIQLLDNEIVVVFGHRRLQAYKELHEENESRFAKISCILNVFSDPEVGRIIAQTVENLGREDLSAIDECRAILEFKTALEAQYGRKISNEEVGKYLGGVHRKTIDIAISIAKWPKKTHLLIQSHEDKFPISLLREIAKKGLSHEQIHQSVEKLLAGISSVPKKVNDNQLTPIATRELKKFLKDQILKADDEQTFKLIVAQKKWLGSALVRKAMFTVLKDLYGEK